MQVVGEVDDPEVLSMINDMGYLLNDTSLPMDDGQVQRPRGVESDFDLRNPAPQSIICPQRSTPPRSPLLRPFET